MYITVIRNNALIINFEIYSLDNFMSLPSDIRPIKRRTKEKPQRTPVSSKKRPEGWDEKGESGGQKYSFLRSLSSDTPGELGDREALRSVFSLPLGLKLCLQTVDLRLDVTLWFAHQKSCIIQTVFLICYGSKHSLKKCTPFK